MSWAIPPEAHTERSWEQYGKRGTPWAVWKAASLNDFWTRQGDRNVSTPNFRPETIRHGEASRQIRSGTDA